MKVLVTGGCGFIGSNLVHELYSQGHNITVVDDLSTGDLGNITSLPLRVVHGDALALYDHLQGDTKDSNKVLVVTCDFSHKFILSRIKNNCYDVVVHMAANPRVEYSVDNPVETHETNVFKTVALFKCASMSKTRVVFSSTCALYGDATELPTSEDQAPNPNSPYGLQKLECEQYARLFNKLYESDIVCLRYFNVYGPRQLGGSAYSTAVSAWCNCVHTGSPLRSDGDGTQTRDMVFVGDIVGANIVAMKRKEKFSGEAINIATGKSISNNEIIEKFKNKFPDIQVKNAPERPGDVKHTLADTSKMKEMLDIYETTPFDEGLAQTLEWWSTLEIKNG